MTIHYISKRFCPLHRLAVSASLGVLLLFSLPVAAGSFRFIAGGDIPYGRFDEMSFIGLLAKAAESEPDFIVHVGDFKGGATPCSDETFERMRDLFQSQPVPLIYTPGDNEWTDCHRKKAGGYDPQERLGRLRQLFFSDPAVLKLDKLKAKSPNADYPENLRFLHKQVMFATVHVVGSKNNRRKKDAAAMAEFLSRSSAVKAHLLEVFAEAKLTGAKAVVLMFHGDPLFERDKPHKAYKSFLKTLTKQLRSWKLPVLAIHGDSHNFIVDHPLVDDETGQAFTRFTRLEVPGAPQVRVVEVKVNSVADSVFEIDLFRPASDKPGWNMAE